MRIRPTAIIFDYGNVLSQSQPPSDVDAMASILNVPARNFRESYWQFRLSYDQAALDPTTYWSSVAEANSRSITEVQIQTLVDIDSRSWARPAPIVPEWASQLHRAGLATALLSNMPTPVRDYIQNCPWLPPFDQRVFSCDLRIVKPAPEIYLHSLDKLGVAASDVLFLDDRPENVRAAEALGIHGIIFTTPEEAAAELARRFDIPVPLVATLEDGDEKN
jgi:putative hydrolase of the HAD superfamily